MSRQRFTCWTKTECSVLSCSTLHRSRTTAQRCELARRHFGSRKAPHYIGEVGRGGAVYAEGVVVLTLPHALLPRWLRAAP